MIRQIRELSQEEKAQVLDANARLLAKRAERAATKAAANIPIRAAGELATELLDVPDLNPFAVMKRGFDALIWADVVSADNVSMGEPLADAIRRGIYTIGKDGERIPITEENWERTCRVVTINGHSFCRAQLYWDGEFWGGGGYGA